MASPRPLDHLSAGVPAEPVVLRRSLVRMLPLLVTEALAAGLLVALSLGPAPVVIYAVPAAAAGTIVIVFMAVRQRTEIGPAGIRIRAARRETMIPWRDLAGADEIGEARAIRLTLRDGRTIVPLPVGWQGREGARFDEVLALIRAGIARDGADVVPKVAPPTVVRRLGWAPVNFFIGGLTFGGLVSAGLVAVHPVAALPAAALIAIAGFLALATARARTELGPDGVRDRALRKEVFIPWSDVEDVTGMESPPRVISIVRRSGGVKILAAVRDDGTAPGGLGFDDLVALVRERAGLGDPADDDGADGLDGADGVEGADGADGVEGAGGVGGVGGVGGAGGAGGVGSAGGVDFDGMAGPPGAPLSLRPSRRPLLWLVPVAAAAAYAVVRQVGEPSALLFAVGYLAVVPVFMAVLALKLLVGRTEAGPAGIRNRLLLRTRTLQWSDVGSLSVMPTLFGKVVQVHVRGGGSKFALAAPRDGLLGRDPSLDATLEAIRAFAPRKVPVQRTGVTGVRAVYGALLAVAGIFIVAFSQPWLEPWWPGRAEASALPAACAAVEPATVRRLVPGGRESGDRRDFSSSESAECEYSGDRGTLRISMERHRRAFGNGGGIENAEEDFDRAWEVAREDVTQGRAAPLGGLGDQAGRTAERDDGDARTTIVARRANVVVEVRYTVEDGPVEATAAEAVGVARAVLGKIRVG